MAPSIDQENIFSLDLTKHPIHKDEKKKRKKKSRKNRSSTLNLHTHPSEYNSWKNAKSRCKNPKRKDKKYAGVTFSKRFDKFADFMVHIGPKSDPSFTLDRIDNNRGYVPGNVRWASKSGQAVNRSTTIFVEHAGQRFSLRTWSEIHGIPYSTLYGRYRRGWRNPEILFERPNKQISPTPRQTKRKPAHDVSASICFPSHKPSEVEIEAAIVSWNRDRGEPEGLVPVRDTDKHRRRFFRITKQIERDAEDRRTKAALRDAELLEKEAKDWNEKVKYMRISMTNEAKTWRKTNGVSDCEAIRIEEEYWREVREEERENRLLEVGIELSSFERLLNKKFRMNFDLRKILETIFAKVPELRCQLPPEFMEGFDFMKGHEKTIEWQVNAHIDRETSRRLEKDREGASNYGRYSCHQQFEDHRDAAIGLGHWNEDDDEDGFQEW